MTCQSCQCDQTSPCGHEDCDICNSPKVASTLASWPWEVPGAGLLLLLTSLRAAAMVHQNNHWFAHGSTFYGDHLLFQRLYDSTNALVDPVGERIVGLQIALDVSMHAQAVTLILGMVWESADAVERSRLAVKACQLAAKQAKRGRLSDGTANLIDDISSKLEEMSYLLQQRA